MFWHARILGHRHYSDRTRGRAYRDCECGRRWYR